MVLDNEVPLNEGGGLVENVVVGLRVELVVLDRGIFFLNLVLDDESHVAEGQRQVLFKDQPVVVLAVHSVTLMDAQDGPVLLERIDNAAILVGCDGAPLLRHVELVFGRNIGLARGVPDHQVIVVYLVGLVLRIGDHVPS